MKLKENIPEFEQETEDELLKATTADALNYKKNIRVAANDETEKKVDELFEATTSDRNNLDENLAEAIRKKHDGIL